MMKTIDETAIWVLKLWVVALLAGLTSAARAQEGDSLQPQGLDRAGIYALRQLDPSLSGVGVRFGVVCRSFTYNQAEEPQNEGALIAMGTQNCGRGRCIASPLTAPKLVWYAS